MIRIFLAKGDRGGEAEIIQGLSSVTCSDPPPTVQIATLGMQTYCRACKQVGYIAPRGPRRPGTAPNGKQWALSGDVNICGCMPEPVFYPAVERRLAMRFTAEEVAALMAPPGTSAEQVLTPRTHDEQFTLLDANHKALAHTYYTIGKSDGSLVHGVTDSKGVTARHKTIGAQTIAIYLGHREP